VRIGLLSGRNMHEWTVNLMTGLLISWCMAHV